MQIYDNVLELIGNTPLVRINRLAKGLEATVVAKLEYFNPAGSVKDRIAVSMLDDAEKKGAIQPGGTVVEGTSGNTGAGLAMACTLRGYRCICTMQDKQSQEKIDLLKAFGAEVVVCPTSVEPEDPGSYYSVSARLTRDTPNAFHPNQYANMANPRIHYETTGPEIWEQTGGKVTAVVIGMGTCGTISGVGKYLKEQDPSIRIIGADPRGSMLHDYIKTGKKVGAHQYKTEGVGEDIIPETLDTAVVDDVIQVGDRDAFLTTRALLRKEGIFTGGSGGMAMWAALRAARGMTKDDLVVCILPDTGHRYLSKIYSDDWMEENQFLDSSPVLNAGRIVALKAKDAPAFVAVAGDTPVCETIALIQTHDISQIPVVDDGLPVGSFDEDQMIEFLLAGRDARAVKVGDIMKDAFPVVEYDTTLADLSRLLTGKRAAVLVKHPLSGRLDIVTKFDLVHSLAPKGPDGGTGK